MILAACAPFSVQAQAAAGATTETLETFTRKVVVWLQRHGESVNNVTGNPFAKMAEPYLTDKGKSDLRARVPFVQEMLAAFGLQQFDIAFSSSLRRTMQTALNMWELMPQNGVFTLKNLKEHHWSRLIDKGNVPYDSVQELLEKFPEDLDDFERDVYNAFQANGGFIKTGTIANWEEDAFSQTTNFDEGVVPEFEKALSNMTDQMAADRPTHIYAATHSKMMRTWFKALGLTGEKIANGAFMVVRGQATWQKDTNGNVVNFKLNLHQKDGVGPDSVQSDFHNGLDVQKLPKIWNDSSAAPNLQMKKRIEDMRRVLYQQTTCTSERWTVTAARGVGSENVAPEYFFKISKGEESWQTEPMRFSVLVDKLQNIAKEMKKQGVNMSNEPSLPRRRMFHSNHNPDVIQDREDKFKDFMVWALENSQDRTHLLDQLGSQQTGFPVVGDFWETFYTQDGKMTPYYYNHSTGVSQWECPAVLVQASASVDNSAQEDDLQRAIEQSQRAYADEQRNELMHLYGINKEIADYVLKAANNDMSRATELIFTYHNLPADQKNAVLQFCGSDSQYEPAPDVVDGFNSAMPSLIAAAA